MACSPNDTRCRTEFRYWIPAFAVLFCGLASSIQAQEEGFKDLFDGAMIVKGLPKAEFTATLSPSNAKPGDEVTLTVTAKLPPDSYIYAMTGD